NRVPPDRPRSDRLGTATHSGRGPTSTARGHLFAQEPQSPRAGQGARADEQGAARPVRAARHRGEEPLVVDPGGAGRPGPTQGRPAGHPSRRTAGGAEEGTGQEGDRQEGSGEEGGTAGSRGRGTGGAGRARRRGS